MMILRMAANVDLNTVFSWITDKEACRRWAGPHVRFPLTLQRLKKDIEFSEENTFVMVNEAGEPVGLGQLLEKEKGRIHMARVIVAPPQRAKGLGEILCRLLIEEGIKRFGNVFFSLNVYSENTTAVRLYQKLGFKPKASPLAPLRDEGVVYMVFMPDLTEKPT